MKTISISFENCLQWAASVKTNVTELNHDKRNNLRAYLSKF